MNLVGDGRGDGSLEVGAGDVGEFDVHFRDLFQDEAADEHLPPNLPAIRRTVRVLMRCGSCTCCGVLRWVL